MNLPFIKNIFTYPKLDRVTNDDGTRFYTCPQTNDPLPSVTTILSKTNTKTYIREWEEAVGKGRAEMVRKEATTIGSFMHEYLENHLQNLPQSTSNNRFRVQAKCMALEIIKHAFPHISEIWGIEASQYFPSLYAGTADLIGVYKGKPTIMDYKNARKMRDKSEIDDYFCQLSAYGIAHNEIYGTNINTGVIFMVDRQDHTFKEFEIKEEDYTKYCDLFLSKCENYYNQLPPN